MSTILKTQAIVLKIFPFSETSRVVVWMTEDHGRLATMIKGAQRRKSQFLGQCDLFYTCELVFYWKPAQGLHIVRECSPTAFRPAFRTDWKAMACASYFADLVNRTSPPYAAHPDSYRLLETALDYFAQGGRLDPGLFWHELKLLDTLGVAPRLRDCLQCRVAMVADGAGAEIEPAFFSESRGGVLCRRCGRASPESIAIAPDVLALLRFWQTSREWRAARSTACSERQVREIGRLLGGFIRRHLELDSPARAVALDILRWPTAA